MNYEYLTLPAIFVATVLISIVIGYWMGRKTITDAPLIQKIFNPKDDKEPEIDEIARCLQGDE